MPECRIPNRTKPCRTVFAVIVACMVLTTAAAWADSSTTTQAKKPVSTHKTVAKKTHPTSTGTKKSVSTASSRKTSRKKKSAKVRGQQKIDSERAQSIQEALIREHYLNGDATGTWNQASEDAMRKYQADNGWQSKTVPDSRALIKLGLGPSKDHWLNPESAMTTVPDRPRAESLPTTSNSAPVEASPAAPSTSSTPVNDPSRPQ